MHIAKKLVLSAAAAAVVAVAAGSGCAQQQTNGEVPFYPGERTGDVTLYRDLQFEDLPVPAQYTLLRDKSHSFQGSQFRSGVFYYEGPLYWRDAAAFFVNEMPKGGWTLQKTDRDMFFVEMRFRKGPEQLIVVVRDNYPHGSRSELQLDNIEKNDLLLRGKLKTEDTGFQRDNW